MTYFLDMLWPICYLITVFLVYDVITNILPSKEHIKKMKKIEDDIAVIFNHIGRK